MNLRSFLFTMLAQGLLVSPALATQVAAVEGVAQAPSYGVLAQTVATAGTLIASGGALALCWKGRFPWEPVEEDIPRSAQKFGGLIIAIVIATIWYRSTQQHLLSSDDLIGLAIVFSGAGLVGLIIYSLLVGVLVYEKTVVVSGTIPTTQKIIGGFWLTAGARQSLHSGTPRPLSVSDLYKGAAFNADYVWPRISRALAKVSFQLTYIVLVAGGTCALAAISLLISSSIR